MMSFINFSLPRLGYEWWEPALLQCGVTQCVTSVTRSEATRSLMSPHPVWLLQGCVWPWLPALVQSYSPSLLQSYQVPSLWCPCPARCTMTHSYWLSSLQGPLALSAPWHMKPSRILAQIFSPTVIRCIWSCMMIHLQSSTEAQKIAEHAWSVKCRLLI